MAPVAIDLRFDPVSVDLWAFCFPLGAVFVSSFELGSGVCPAAQCCSYTGEGPSSSMTVSQSRQWRKHAMRVTDNGKPLSQEAFKRRTQNM